MIDAASELRILTSVEFLEDPYPFYARLRADDPVHFVEPFNAWILTRFADVESAFTDERFRVGFERYQVNRVGPDVIDHDYFRVGKEFLVCTDPPVHTKLRRIFRAPFTSSRVRELRGLVERLANEAIDRFVDAGRVDIIGNYSARVPLSVMSALLGVPTEDEPLILQWVAAFYHILEVSPMTPDQLAAADDTSRRARDYFRALVEDRRRHAGDDFVSGVLAANGEDEDPMTDDQIVANLFLLYFAGHDTQKLQFGNMLATLDRHPEALRELATDPDRIPELIPELYRWDTVGQFMGRTAEQDVALGGKTIRKGQTVMICMGAANRDPAVFLDPDRFDLRREQGIGFGLRHITFGAGRHHCLGAQMAQSNLPMLLQILLRRIPGIRLDRDHAVRHPSIATRGYDLLPAVWS